MCAANIESIPESAGNAYLTDFLDDLIPLRDASHADVRRYEVAIPMRYAECFAELADGRRVGLRDQYMFIGWIGHRPCESLLFRSQGLHITIDVSPDGADGPVRDVSVKRASMTSRDRRPGLAHRVRKFIGIDGSLVRLPVT